MLTTTNMNYKQKNIWAFYNSLPISILWQREKIRNNHIYNYSYNLEKTFFSFFADLKMAPSTLFTGTFF